MLLADCSIAALITHVVSGLVAVTRGMKHGRCCQLLLLQVGVRAAISRPLKMQKTSMTLAKVIA